MAMTTTGRAWVISLATLFFLGLMTVTPSVAQDANQDEVDKKVAKSDNADAKKVQKKKKKDVAKDENADEDKDAGEKEDPLAVPEDATAKELFAFIRKAKMSRGRTLATVQKSARAAVKAAAAIRELDDVELDDEKKAIAEQLSALTFLSRYDADSKQQLTDLIDGLESDPRPEIAKIAAVEAFKARIGGARSASKRQQQKLVDELKEMIGEAGLDRELFSLASSLARSIGYSENSGVAAKLYEDLAVMMGESEDELIRSRAGKMVGAARRMRLPGNFMEVMGKTADGEEFQWDAYRGKVVLVDFWASWCGPCRAEVPNMKRNLELYGEKGFEIVGVNLDRTLNACENYVEKEELSWPNLISDKEDERGWDNPLATYYGISAIPTAILVDQEGKVVSLRARGGELDRLLEEMLGPLPEESDDDADASAEDDEDEDDE